MGGIGSLGAPNAACGHASGREAGGENGHHEQQRGEHTREGASVSAFGQMLHDSSPDILLFLIFQTLTNF
jgi:hypothetical protein